jgi:ribosomal protein S18 acetylase RimI-like enzyme
MPAEIQITHGFREGERTHLARLYWQAFGAKLGKVMGPKDRALPFFERVFNPGFALAARDQSGNLLGVAGFKTAEGGLVEGGWREIAQVYGWFGAAWRTMLLSVLERDLQPGVFQMDGIFVDETARGMGVGTALLNAIMDEARKRNCREVQLDVIDTNPRARALYERVGFTPVLTEGTGPFRYLFGFKSATRMSRPV